MTKVERLTFHRSGGISGLRAGDIVRASTTGSTRLLMILAIEHEADEVTLVVRPPTRLERAAAWLSGRVATARLWWIRRGRTRTR